jgi:peptidoglycan-N-acetylglucosamine deacetylase
LLQVLTGSSVRTLRPPYANDTMAETGAEAHVVEIASKLGYSLIGANLNPEDWNGTSKSDIVRQIVERAERGEGTVVELHDAGGDRSKTVESLADLIYQLRAKGFRFIELPELMGQAWKSDIPVADDGWVSVARVGFESLTFEGTVFFAMIWACILITTVRFATLLVSAFMQHSAASKKTFGGRAQTVSVILPAYNEEKVIVRSIEYILNSDYQNLKEVIVVDDGSSDNTAAVARNAYAHDPRVRVFRIPNGGKSHALNFGIKQAHSKLVVLLDADTLIAPEAVRMLARHFEDPTIGAVAGNAKVGNRVNLVTKLQALEYITSQNLERAGLAKMDAITVIPGAIGMWRREAIIRAKGFSSATLAEDCDLTLSIHRLGYRITHEM